MKSTGHNYVRSIYVGLPQKLVIALFIRDAIQLSVAPEMPPLSPPVAKIATPQFDTSAACAEWSDWWERLLDREAAPRIGKPHPLASLPDASQYPVLASLVATVGQAAVDYANRSGREAPAECRPIGPSAKESVEREIIMLTRPRFFHLRRNPIDISVTQLPVAGQLSWPRPGHHLVISGQTRSDPGAYRAALAAALTLGR